MGGLHDVTSASSDELIVKNFFSFLTSGWILPQVGFLGAISFSSRDLTAPNALCHLLLEVEIRELSQNFIIFFKFPRENHFSSSERKLLEAFQNYFCRKFGHHYM